MHRTRYAIVGLCGRSRMFTDAIRGPYRARGELAASCDSNQTRMNDWNRRWGGTRIILTGMAAKVAFETGLPVKVDDLIKLP
jgi:hypothetical protein